MRRLAFLLPLALLVAGLTFVPTVSASCDSTRIILRSDSNGGGYQRVQYCFEGDTSLAGFDNITSSVRVVGNIPVCLWTQPNYTGSGLRIIAPYPPSGWYNLPGWMNDKASSIEWGTNCLTD